MTEKLVKIASLIFGAGVAAIICWAVGWHEEPNLFIGMVMGFILGVFA